MWTPDQSIIITATQRDAEIRATAIESFRLAIQSHVDDTARSRLYDSGNSLASYVTSTNPAWAAEAITFVAWRDAVWLYAYTELDKVTAQEREVPTVEDFINELPTIVWSEEGE